MTAKTIFPKPDNLPPEVLWYDSIRSGKPAQAQEPQEEADIQLPQDEGEPGLYQYPRRGGRGPGRGGGGTTWATTRARITLNQLTWLKPLESLRCPSAHQKVVERSYQLYFFYPPVCI